MKRIAVIGAGRMAKAHAEAFAARPDCELVGITSRTRSRAEDLAVSYPGMAVYDDIGTMSRESAADVVVVAVNEPFMRLIAEEAAEHDWVLFLEKPPALNYAEAKVLVDTVEAKGNKAYVGLNRRHLPSTNAAAQLLADDDEPRYIHVQDQQDLHAELLKSNEVIAHHLMYANSIHLIDYLSYFGRGDIIRVEPLQTWTQFETEVVHARILFASGDIGFYEGVWQRPGPWGVTITTAKQRLEMRPLETITQQLAGSRACNRINLVDECSSIKPGFAAQADALIKAVDGGEIALPTLSDALRSMSLVHAIFGT